MVRTARSVLAWMASSILVLGESASAADRALPTLQPEVLRIGTYFVNPPFEYRAGGKHVGFEVDLMTEVARQADARIGRGRRPSSRRHEAERRVRAARAQMGRPLASAAAQTLLVQACSRCRTSAVSARTR